MILDMHSDIINANYHQNSNKLFKASLTFVTLKSWKISLEGQLGLDNMKKYSIDESSSQS